MDKETLDFSLILNSVNSEVPLFYQLVSALINGTDEVKQILSSSYKLILECKVCHNLFRTLPNFILHKRNYCSLPNDEYSNTVGFMDFCQQLCESTKSETQNQVSASLDQLDKEANLMEIKHNLPRTHRRKGVAVKLSGVGLSASGDEGSITVVEPQDCVGYVRMDTRSKLDTRSNEISEELIDEETVSLSKIPVNENSESFRRLSKRTDCDVKRLVCCLCSLDFHSIYALELHLNWLHSMSSVAPRSCCICSIIFASVKECLLHCETVHNVTRVTAKIPIAAFHKSLAMDSRIPVKKSFSVGMSKDVKSSKLGSNLGNRKRRKKKDAELSVDIGSNATSTSDSLSEDKRMLVKISRMEFPARSSSEEPISIKIHEQSADTLATTQTTSESGKLGDSDSDMETDLVKIPIDENCDSFKRLSKRTDCDVRRLICCLCSVEFHSVVALDLHMHWLHSVGKQSTKDCSVCLAKFTSAKDCFIHCKMEHGVTKTSAKIPNSVYFKALAADSQPPFKGRAADKRLVKSTYKTKSWTSVKEDKKSKIGKEKRKKGRPRKMSTVHKTKEVTLEVDKGTWVSQPHSSDNLNPDKSGSLVTVFSRPHSPNFTCMICSTSFITKGGADLHLQDEHNEYAVFFSCFFCQKASPSIFLLEEHLFADHSLDVENSKSSASQLLKVCWRSAIVKLRSDSCDDLQLLPSVTQANKSTGAASNVTSTCSPSSSSDIPTGVSESHEASNQEAPEEEVTPTATHLKLNQSSILESDRSSNISDLIVLDSWDCHLVPPLKSPVLRRHSTPPSKNKPSVSPVFPVHDSCSVEKPTHFLLSRTSKDKLRKGYSSLLDVEFAFKPNSNNEDLSVFISPEDRKDGIIIDSDLETELSEESGSKTLSQEQKQDANLMLISEMVFDKKEVEVLAEMSNMECRLCGKKYPVISSLLTHIALSHIANGLTCSLCPSLRFFSKTKAAKHCKSHHPGMSVSLTIKECKKKKGRDTL